MRTCSAEGYARACTRIGAGDSSSLLPRMVAGGSRSRSLPPGMGRSISRLGLRRLPVYGCNPGQGLGPQGLSPDPPGAPTTSGPASAGTPWPPLLGAAGVADGTGPPRGVCAPAGFAALDRDGGLAAAGLGCRISTWLPSAAAPGTGTVARWPLACPRAPLSITAAHVATANKTASATSGFASDRTLVTRQQ